MTMHNNILIRNIYYMLSYAFQALKERNYEHVDKEDFEHVDDMFAEILVRAVTQQLKQGLFRQYIIQTEELSTLRGKLNLTETIKNKIKSQQLLTCDVDNLSPDNLYNQILKTTMHHLLKSDDVKMERKNAIRKLLLYFADIQTVNARSIRWDALVIHRNNYAYHWLMYICYFIINKYLLTTSDGEIRVLSFTEDLLHRLYEKFVLSYFQKHHPDLNASSEYIDWDLQESQTSFLPSMHSDIMLHYGENTLIIDTKYYSKILQTRYDKATFHSNNVYQIFAYVLNKDVNQTGKVKGMLLYAETEHENFPPQQWTASNHQFIVRTLNLNQDFASIRADLDAIANIVKK